MTGIPGPVHQPSQRQILPQHSPGQLYAPSHLPYIDMSLDCLSLWCMLHYKWNSSCQAQAQMGWKFRAYCCISTAILSTLSLDLSELARTAFSSLCMAATLTSASSSSLLRLAILQRPPPHSLNAHLTPHYQSKKHGLDHWVRATNTSSASHGK